MATRRSAARAEAVSAREMLLAEMDGAGVSRVVIVPPSWEGDRNDLALEAARLHPKRFAVKLSWLAGADLEWVMGRGVCEWLGWPRPGS